MIIFSGIVVLIVGLVIIVCIYRSNKKPKPSPKKSVKPKPLTPRVKISGKVFRDVLLHFNKNGFRRDGFYNPNKLKGLYRYYKACIYEFVIESEEYFLAQVLHESQFLRFKEENLRYSAVVLRSVFGKYFKNDTMAQKYEKRPKLIANRVYANRIGNGDGGSGDGYRFRGRGYIQLTGRANYEEIAKDLSIDAVNNPDILSYDKYAWFCAGWFWNKRGLDEVSDFKRVTKIINGGYNGLRHRQDILQIIRSKRRVKKND